jgi:hypothetical protein
MSSGAQSDGALSGLQRAGMPAGEVRISERGAMINGE